MSSNTTENHISVLEQFKNNKSLIIAFTALSEKGTYKEDSFVHLLTQMQVTALSKFSSPLWDYNKDVLNPPKNVQGAKLRINFDKYVHIPKFIIIEIKCLLHYLTLNAKIFSEGGKNNKQKAKIKPNTAISHFESGLRFLNHLFEILNEDGVEFIASRYKSLSDIQQMDFNNAAKTFSYRTDSATEKFFYYLKHPFAINVLDSPLQIDFESLEFPEWVVNSREERMVFENNIFEKLVSYSSFRIISFLSEIGEDVKDKTGYSHFQEQKNVYAPSGICQDLLNDYTILRLKSKGYSDSEISEVATLNDALCHKGKIVSTSLLRAKIKEKYSIESLNDIRESINEVYYAACYIIAQFTAMRPSELSEIRLSTCLLSEEGDDLLFSEVNKGRGESYGLFDDNWLVIPIIEDAIKAAQIISRLKNNDFLFSNVDTIKAGTSPSCMASTGITHAINNYLLIVFNDPELVGKISFSPYMTRHTLAYQLHRVELGLPFISYQLKHIVNKVDKYTPTGATSDVTMGYGEIADRISGNSVKGNKKTIRHLAEIERVKAVMDPDATYIGAKGAEHKARLKKAFEGYMAPGYTKEEVYQSMAEQGMAIINVGMGFCFGGTENFDESLPCIGTLRCNPIRCSNAIVTKSNAVKWREIYFSNKALLRKEGYEDHKDQLMDVIKEAELVLEYLGEKVII